MKKNIVIIDDSALMRRVLSDIINSDQMFHVVAVAENGKDALEKMEQIESIDAIVLDLNMPVMSGVEFLRELKNRKILFLIAATTLSISALMAVSSSRRLNVLVDIALDVFSACITSLAVDLSTSPFTVR